MTRWLLALGTVLALGVALWPIHQYRPELGGRDEILAYELSGERGVNSLIPGGVQEIAISSWLVMPERVVHNPYESHAYEVRVRVELASGAPLVDRRFELVSRISGDPRLPVSEGRFAARVAESDEWVTDGRTIRINTSELGGRAGKLRVLAPGSHGGSVLVRLSYAERRSALERALLERTLQPEQRRQVVGNRAALGFSDLPLTAREQALETWERRLTAEGRSGIDFMVRRLLIGNFRAAAEVDAPAVGFGVGRQRPALLNVRGGLELWVEGTLGTTVFLQDEAREPEWQTIGASSRVHFVLASQGPRSIAVWSEPAANLRFWASKGAKGQILGSPGLLERGEQLELVPDYRFQRFWDLDPNQPLRYESEMGQGAFGVVLRGAAADSATEAKADVSVRWEGPKGRILEHSDALELTLPVSGAASAEDITLSDTEARLLLPPQGARAMLLTGSTATAVSVWVQEPFVPGGVLEPAYRDELGSGRVWKSAPFEQRATATLLPDGSLELTRAGRSSSVRVLPRIATEEPAIGDPEERVLRPRGATASRHIYRKALHIGGTPLPEQGWLLFETGQEKSIVVAASESALVPIELSYRTCAAALGERFTVALDGERTFEQPLLSTMGTVILQVAAGQHRLRVDGIGACGSALVQVAPAETGPILKRQSVYQLRRGRDLHVPFVRQHGQLGSIVLMVVSEGEAAHYSIGYEFARGAVRRRTGVFARRITELEGTLVGSTGGQERTSLSQADVSLGEREGKDFLGKEVIRLGDDLAVGEQELVLRSRADLPLWVRAVWVGRVSDESGSQPR